MWTQPEKLSKSLLRAPYTELAADVVGFVSADGVTAMRLWFRRRDDKAGKQRSTREKGKKDRSAPSPSKGRHGPPQDDPIKNWETADQSFLRQAGDPFLDG
jgi:hypothetical protein